MPRWNNQPLTLYHGTDTTRLGSYGPLTKYSILVGFQVQLALCNPLTDFGRGFYTTTWEVQARHWANERALKSQANGPSAALLLSFSMNRDQIAALECLSFVRASSDYWDLVSDCRIGFAPHQRQGNASGSAYDVVYGPVSLWAQQLIIHDADQVSFHTAKAVAALPPPNVYDVAPSSNGLFP